MEKRTWNVFLNGRVPAIRKFETFDDAVAFVADETGESEERVKSDHEDGCPTMPQGSRDEYDIEKERAEVKSND